MAKSKEQKRAEARIRLQESTWENSKAKRTGSRTQEQWNTWKSEELSPNENTKRKTG